MHLTSIWESKQGNLSTVLLVSNEQVYDGVSRWNPHIDLSEPLLNLSSDKIVSGMNREKRLTDGPA